MSKQKIYIKRWGEGSSRLEFRGHTLMLIVYTQGQVKQADEGEVTTH